MKIERSRELYAAIKTMAPHVQWNEPKWRAYKATHICPTDQKLWIHFAIDDLVRQTEGKIGLEAVCALLEIDQKKYQSPPLLRETESETEEVRRKLLMAGYTKSDQHLIVWQIHQQGLKGEIAAKAAGVSKATFSRVLKQVYDVVNERYKSSVYDTIWLGDIALYLDGVIYDEELLEWFEAALSRKLDKPAPGDHWLKFYIFELQQVTLNKSDNKMELKTPLIDGWLANKIAKQKKAKAREQANLS